MACRPVRLTCCTSSGVAAWELKDMCILTYICTCKSSLCVVLFAIGMDNQTPRRFGTLFLRETCRPAPRESLRAVLPGCSPPRKILYARLEAYRVRYTSVALVAYYLLHVCSTYFRSRSKVEYHQPYPETHNSAAPSSLSHRGPNTGLVLFGTVFSCDPSAVPLFSVSYNTRLDRSQIRPGSTRG